jgi:Icc-related predicted phosphoesterase
MRLLFLGDIHGNFNLINQYIKLYDIRDANIIQVGDFGIGFNTFEKDFRNLKRLHDSLESRNVHVWAIRGNHDYKPYFDNDPFGFKNIHLVSDYSVYNLSGNNILFIGGAISVDRKWRLTKRQKNGDFNSILGVESWWPDEVFVLDQKKLGEMRDIDIVVTHTAPHYCEPDNTFGFGPFIDGIVKETGDLELKTDLNFERNQLTTAFTILKMNNDIKENYYGHFHKKYELIYEGTKHRLLDVGELYEKRE